MNYRYGILLVLLFAACKGKDISGVYVRPINHEFARGTDTIRIQALKENDYLIKKSSRFRKIRNGKFLDFETHHRNITGQYDPKLNIIRLPDHLVLNMKLQDDNETFVYGSKIYKRVDADIND